MQFGTQWVFKSVQAAHLASALLGCKARGDRVGGIVFNDHNHLEFKPVNRQKGVLAMLNGLIQLQQQRQTNACRPAPDTLLQGCARLRRLAHPGSLIFLLSDFSQMSDHVSKHLQRLTQHCEVICYHITDPPEKSLPSSSAAQPTR